MNAGLRDNDKLVAIEPFARLLDSALTKLGNVPERTVYRGVGIAFSSIKDRFC